MNEDGLVASATFGGSRAQGRGFSVILLLRYVLETCSRVEQAIAALSRIPIALSQNVTLLEPSGAYATVFLGPGREPVISAIRVCTNHQDIVTPSPSVDMTRSVERQQVLLQALDDPATSLRDLIAQFLETPIYSRRVRSPTVYTAVYWPGERRVDYLWPGKTWGQRIGHFECGDYTHDYGALIASGDSGLA